MDYNAYLKNKIKDTEKILNDEMAAISPEAPAEIVKAMEYSLMAGGKRLRPIMLSEAAKTFSGNTEGTERFAAAIEMIHTSSLIHDDLPAMDNDDLRRGRPTSHKVFGEAMAILAGDALLNHANEIMAEYLSEHPEKRFAKAQYEIVKATGISGMIGGQTIDVYAEKTGVPITDIKLMEKMYSMKTCALLVGALKAGAYIGGADDEAAEKFAEYGLLIGLAFQIIDDILDIIGDEKLLGKPIGSDDENGKTTFVSLVGIEKAKKIADEYTKTAKNLIKTIPDTGFFIFLADYLAKREF